MTINLTWEEALLAATVGVRRRVKAQSVKRREVHGDAHYRPPWDLDIEGALAEMAFAKFMGAYWAGQTDPDKGSGDVMEGGIAHHVRSTDREEGALILHPTDSDEGIFVLMVGGGIKWRCAGWMRGEDGKQQRWWRANVPHAAYFVSQGDLEKDFDR